MMRWRGKEGDALVGDETRDQEQFIFKDDPSSSANFRGTKIVFAMIQKGQHILFEGTKTANVTAEDIPKWNLEEEWKSLFVGDWEMDTESDLESDGSYKGSPKTHQSAESSKRKTNQDQTLALYLYHYPLTSKLL